MAQAEVITFIENGGRNMTFEEGLAFVERSRRQMERFSELPAMKGTTPDLDREARIKKTLDELELSIRTSMATL